MKQINILTKYWHTVKYLKRDQILGRLWLKIPHSMPSLDYCPPIRPITGSWVTACCKKPSMTGATKFRFLNEERSLDCLSLWNSTEADRLWLYNLHYFEDLTAIESIDRLCWHIDLISKWILENPPGFGVGWEPYPISQRIVNWIKWINSGARAEPEMFHSICVQTRWLSNRLEWHLLGNHLFSNAKSLVFSGLFFEGPEASRWLQTGIKILDGELDEQILEDGGQFELSPMYHCQALEDVLDLLNCSRAWPSVLPEQLVSKLARKASAMIKWMRVMTHPDRSIALFNDSTISSGPNPDHLIDYAQRLGIIEEVLKPTGLTSLSESGYVRAQNSSAVLIADVGRIGPDYLPGHAHADTLSFELSLFGKRWFVDSGCSLYQNSQERLRQRGTSAHNTVIVDHFDSSEVWNSFRVARRAKPFGLHTKELEGFIKIECSHDGYRRLDGNVVHNRKWILDRSSLRIEDRLYGSWGVAQAILYLHPDLNVKKIDDRAASLTNNDKKISLVVERGAMDIERSTWHPEFGVSIPSTRIVITFHSDSLSTQISW